MRSAHTIKGAAANLMCQQLRRAATMLEDAARCAHDQGEAASPLSMQQAVQQGIANLKQATQNFFAYLQSMGI